MNKLRKKLVTQQETIEAYASNCQSSCESGCYGPCSAHMYAAYEANINSAYYNMYK